MTFLAQAAAAVQQMTPSSSSPTETIGLLGLAYALVRLLDGLIAKILPNRIGKRTCAWDAGDVSHVASILKTVDGDGRPRIFVPQSLERGTEKQLELANATAGALSRAVSILDKIDERTHNTNTVVEQIAQRPCPIGKDARP